MSGKANISYKSCYKQFLNLFQNFKRKATLSVEAFKPFQKAYFVVELPLCGCSSMAEQELPKLKTGVRFSSPAPALVILLAFR